MMPTLYLLIIWQVIMQPWLIQLIITNILTLQMHLGLNISLIMLTSTISHVSLTLVRVVMRTSMDMINCIMSCFLRLRVLDISLSHQQEMMPDMSTISISL